MPNGNATGGHCHGLDHGAMVRQEIKTQTIGLTLYYGNTTYVIYTCLIGYPLDIQILLRSVFLIESN